MSNIASRSAADKADKASVSITFGKSSMDLIWTDCRSMSFDDFARILTAPPAIGGKDGTCFVPATFRGYQRRMDQAEQIDVAVLDSDCGHNAEEIIAAVEAKGWEAVVHSTYSHGTSETKVACSAYDKWRQATGRDDPEAFMLEKKGYLPRVVVGAKIKGKVGKDYIVEHQPCPKFRIVLLLSKPWVAGEYADQTTANDVWKVRILALAAALGLQSDQSCTDTSRLFYLPRIKSADQEFVAEHVAGEPCNIWDLPEAPAEAEEPRHNAARDARRSKDSPAGAEAGVAESAPGVHADASARAGEQIDLRRARDTTGAEIDLLAWSVSHGPRFEAAQALRAKAEHIFGNRKSRVKWHIQCPFDDEHTASNDRTGTYVVNASEIGRAGLPSFTSGFYIGCMHNACAGRDRLAFVARMLSQGVLSVADLTAADFLTERELGTPEWPAPTLSIADARKLARAHAEYAAKFAKPPVPVGDTRGMFTDLDNPRAMFFQWDVAVGKTEAQVTAFLPLAVGAAARSESVIFAVPVHKLSDELKARVERTAKAAGLQISVAVYRGRNQIDPDAPNTGTLMCHIPEEPGSLREEAGNEVLKALVPMDHTCETPDGRRCPGFNTCGTQRMLHAKADIWIIPHARLTTKRPDNIGRPLAMVVDENCRSAVTEGFGDNPRRVPLEEIRRRREVPDAGASAKDGNGKAATEKLNRIMETYARALLDATVGEIATKAFVDAEITEELAADAITLLYRTAAPVQFSAQDSSTKIMKAAKAAARKNGSYLGSVIQFAKIVHWHLDRQEEFLRGIRVEPGLRGAGGSTFDAVRLRWLKPIHQSWIPPVGGFDEAGWKRPLIHLDATGRVENVEAIFGPVNHVPMSVKIENAYVRQILWPGSKNLWESLDDEIEAKKVQADTAGMTDEVKSNLALQLEKLRQNADSRRANIRRIVNHLMAHEFAYRGQGAMIHMPELARRLAEAESEAAKREGRPARKTQTHWRIDCLLLCQKGLEEQICKEYDLPENIAIEHFGNLVGVDRYKGVAYCLVVGRPSARPRDVEFLAEVIHGVKIERIGDKPYPRRNLAMRVHGQERGPVVQTPWHPDPRAEAIRWEISEGAVIQAVGRARAPNRRLENPVHIDLICDMALPIEVDQAVDWREAKKLVDLLTLARKGFVLGDGRPTAEWAWKLAPEIWVDSQNYRDWSRRGGRSASSLWQNPISNISSMENATVSARPRPRDVFGEFGVFVTRMAEGRYEQVVGIDLAQHPNPKAALEAQVGLLADFRIVHLPIRAAIAALRSTKSQEANRATLVRLIAMRDAEAQSDWRGSSAPGVANHFKQIKRPLWLPNGWVVGGPLPRETEKELATMIEELRLHSAPAKIDRVVEAAAAIDPTAREWLPPLIADWRRSRVRFVPRKVPRDGRLHTPFSTEYGWIDDDGKFRQGHPPMTERQVMYARRLRELTFYEFRPVRHEDGSEVLAWVDIRTGEPKEPPRVPRVIRLVDDGVERWHIVEALPIEAKTDAERITDAMLSEIGDGG